MSPITDESKKDALTPPDSINAPINENGDTQLYSLIEEYHKLDRSPLDAENKEAKDCLLNKIRMLLESGADFTKENKKGKSPLSLLLFAHFHLYPEIFTLFLDNDPKKLISQYTSMGNLPRPYYRILRNRFQKAQNKRFKELYNLFVDLLIGKTYPLLWDEFLSQLFPDYNVRTEELDIKIIESPEIIENTEISIICPYNYYLILFFRFLKMQFLDDDSNIFDIDFTFNLAQSFTVIVKMTELFEWIHFYRAYNPLSTEMLIEADNHAKNHALTPIKLSDNPQIRALQDSIPTITDKNIFALIAEYNPRWKLFKNFSKEQTGIMKLHFPLSQYLFPLQFLNHDYTSTLTFSKTTPVLYDCISRACTQRVGSYENGLRNQPPRQVLTLFDGLKSLLDINDFYELKTIVDDYGLSPADFYEQEMIVDEDLGPTSTRSFPYFLIFAVSLSTLDELDLAELQDKPPITEVVTSNSTAEDEKNERIKKEIVPIIEAERLLLFLSKTNIAVTCPNPFYKNEKLFLELDEKKQAQQQNTVSAESSLIVPRLS